MALGMQERLTALMERHQVGLRLRIGVHSGPVVAGVIGRHKFTYDLWGDTVNTASRMESHGEPGRVHVSQSTRDLLGDTFRFVERGPITVKGKGTLHSFFVEGPA
jgi:class 3 adenylate cyclase